MRLIQLNLLLLLTVIRSAIASPYKNASSGASGDRQLGQVPKSRSEIFSFIPLDDYIGTICDLGHVKVPKRELRKCLKRNCRRMVKDCRDEGKCKRNMNCFLNSNSLPDRLECTPDAKVTGMVNCAKKAGCFVNDACPTQIHPKLGYTDAQYLMANFSDVTWWAVLTAKDENDGSLTCTKLEVSRTGFQLRLNVSLCPGSVEMGACATQYRGFSANVRQYGSTITTESLVTMKLYFHAIEKNKYAIVTPCQEGPDGIHWSKPAVLSPFMTYDELLKNSNDRQSTENYISGIFTLLGEDYDAARRIDARNCKN